VKPPNKEQLIRETEEREEVEIKYKEFTHIIEHHLSELSKARM
jgi:hypothetical protein